MVKDTYNDISGTNPTGPSHDIALPSRIAVSWPSLPPIWFVNEMVCKCEIHSLEECTEKWLSEQSCIIFKGTLTDLLNCIIWFLLDFSSHLFSHLSHPLPHVFSICMEDGGGGIYCWAYGFDTPLGHLFVWGKKTEPPLRPGTSNMQPMPVVGETQTQLDYYKTPLSTPGPSPYYTGFPPKKTPPSCLGDFFFSQWTAYVRSRSSKLPKDLADKFFSCQPLSHALWTCCCWQSQQGCWQGGRRTWFTFHGKHWQVYSSLLPTNLTFRPRPFQWILGNEVWVILAKS